MPEQEITGEDVILARGRNEPALWAKYSKIKLGSEYFSFDKRPYLFEPMTTRHPRKGAMKAPQKGFSISMAILPSIHGLIFGRYRHGVLYLSPSLIDMSEYSKSIIDPLIKDNPNSIGRFVKTAGKGVDTAGLKRIGFGNLYMRGAKLQPTDTGGDASSRLSGISVDIVIFDEIDFMNSAVMADARGRMKCIPEEQRQEIYLANPSAEDYGIALLWQKSDQRHLYHPCSCGCKDNCPTKDFLNNPEKTVGIYPERGPLGEERGFIRCKKCEKPLNVLDCEYHADWPSRMEYAFWQVGNLSSINDNPARIRRDFRNPPEGNLAGFYKNELGLPYSSAEDKLQKHTVLACCGHDCIPEHHNGPCAMGVDNSDGKHIVIITKTGNDRYELIKAVQVSDFNGVYDLIRRFNIKSCVVDMRPNKDSAQQFQKAAAQNRCKVFLCEYSESPLQDALFNEDTGIVKVYRTGIFDLSHRIITNQQILLPRQCTIIDNFASQCCNCAKQRNERIKDKAVFNYNKTGDQSAGNPNNGDHYRNSLNYALVACMGYRIKIIPKGNIAEKEEYAMHYTTQI